MWDTDALYDHLYGISDPFATRPFRLLIGKEWLHSMDALFRGELRPETPVPFYAGGGGQATDLMWGYSVSSIIISQRVVDLFQAEGFAGWSTYPVTVRDRESTLLEGYYGLAVTGRSGPLQRERSSREPRPPVLPGLPERAVYRGMYFDESRWDGTDIFLIWGGLYLIVKETVKKVLERAKVRNVIFTTLRDYEINVRSVDGPAAP
ncbi:MAG: hypothetical protein ACYC4R_11625 [Anaerolineae bacterium]